MRGTNYLRTFSRFVHFKPINKYLFTLTAAFLTRATLLTAQQQQQQQQSHYGNMAGSLDSISAAFITCGSKEEALKLSRGLISQKLAACVNIIPGVTSVYEWNGKIEEDQEHLLMVKTRTTRVNCVSKYIRENHSYDVAEVISTKIEYGNPPYIEWVLNNVQPLDSVVQPVGVEEVKKEEL